MIETTNTDGIFNKYKISICENDVFVVQCTGV